MRGDGAIAAADVLTLAAEVTADALPPSGTRSTTSSGRRPPGSWPSVCTSKAFTYTAAPFESFGLPWTRSFAEDVAPLPSDPTELVFGLFPTDKRFRAGHRIRLTVLGADRNNHVRVYPNPPPMVAVYRDAPRPSRILLPEVPTR